VKPTEILKDEHRVIELVLDCLERMIEQAGLEQELDRASAKEAVDFFRNFADRCHHAKEETHLFPAMEAKGFPRDGGPTGVMRYEHAQGRAVVREMDELLEPAAAGDAKALASFVEHGRRYIDILRRHIEKEDHCLYPMADQAFSEQDQQDLLATFQKVESDEIGTGTHAKYLQIADQLADRFGVERAPVAETTHEMGCCGH